MFGIPKKKTQKKTAEEENRKLIKLIKFVLKKRDFLITF